jgi:metal-responsive CopG/Arc/MetJ family transcriptional regulator
MESKVEEMVRERVSITLPKECIAWIDKQVESRVYANRSHAIEVLIIKTMPTDDLLKMVNKPEKKE